MTCLDDAHEHARRPAQATTSAGRFTALRSRIRRATRTDDRAALEEEIAADLQELEQIVRAADDVLNANSANKKHDARLDLSTRLRRWRCWPEPT